MSITVDSAPSTVVAVTPTGPIPGTPLPTSPAATALWKVVVCDRLGYPLAELTTVCFDLSLNRGLNRPAAVTFKVPSWHALASTLHSDGSPYVEVGVRSLKVYRRDDPGAAWQIVFNGLVWHLEDEGDADETWTQVTCYDPMIWWRYRPARGYDYSRKTKALTYNGNYVTPHWSTPKGPGPATGTAAVCAPQILRMMLDFSTIATDPTIGEGPIGLAVWAGIVEETGPNCSLDLADTPYTIADVHKMLTATRCLDAWIEPIDNVGIEAMGNLMAVRQAGTDKPWLHLQYGTGNYSVQELKRERDMDSIGNKIWYYLGEKTDELHYQGSITIDGMPKGDGTDDALPLPDEPPGYRSLVETRVWASRTKYGVFMSISVYDENKNVLKSHERFARLWQMESYLRAEPREMLYVTATRNGPYDMFDLELGDVIRVSAFDGIRRGFTGAVQRIFGYTVQVDNDMVEAIVDLETSPNAD